MSALDIIGVVALGALYLGFCAYWWRGGHGLGHGRARPPGDDDGG